MKNEEIENEEIGDYMPEDDIATQFLGAVKPMCNLEQYYGFLKLNAVRHIWRSDYGGENIEDLKRAVWYLNRLITELENQ